MFRPSSLVVAFVGLSAVGFGQIPFTISQDSSFQVGYAANLNVGDSFVNLSNDGANGGPLSKTTGNICVNTYVFDPQEEEISCCSCLVTPNGMNSLSAKTDLISNNLTPSVPTSIVIKLVGSTPAPDASLNLTICNPAALDPVGGNLTFGMLAWGATLEPNATPGTYGIIQAPFLQGALSTGPNSELNALTQVCNFIQANGSGYGICKSCRLGALAGPKQ